MKNVKMFFCYMLLIHVVYSIKKESWNKRLKKLSVRKLKCLSLETVSPSGKGVGMHPN
jgi:hypothetical protein